MAWRNFVWLLIFVNTISASIYLQDSKSTYDSTDFSLDEEYDMAEIFKKTLKSKVKRSLFQSSSSTTAPLQPPSVAHPGRNNDVVTETVLTNDLGFRGTIAYAGDTNKVVMLLTRRFNRSVIMSSTLYRSIDDGRTFKKVILATGAKPALIAISAMDRSKVLIAEGGSKKALYYSSNGGVSFTTVSITFTATAILWNPSMVNFVIAYDGSTRTLYSSSNYGKSWQLVKNKVSRYYWAIPKVDTDQSVVYLEAVGSDNKYYVYTKSLQRNVLTLFDQAIGTILPNSLVVSNQYVFTYKKEYNPQNSLSNETMYVSYKRQSFKRALFPIIDFHKHHLIVDTSEGQVFLAVNHKTNLTNVYVSDATGTKYTLTLENVYDAPEIFWRLGRPYVDFYKVNSMLGTYLANIASTRSIILPANTLITYDAGGTWMPLKAPTVDKNGHQTRCSLPKCSLHLSMNFGKLLGYDSLVSSKSAPGLIVATGNYGTTVSFRRRNTFVSVDGGYTWKEAEDPYRDYTIQDYGSLIVSSGINYQKNKTYIRYSCDSGKSWKKLLIANHTLYIINLLTEPGQKTLVTTVAGTVLVNNHREWVIVRLNFTALLPRMCRANDYFNWTANDPLSGKNKCLLGQKQVFKIRKPSSCCYNGKYFQPFNVRTSCVCTSEDFICNYGFQRLDSGSNCTVVAVDQSMCVVNTSSYMTPIYRKVPSDKCKGGIENLMLKPHKFPCKDALPPFHRKSTNLGLYVGLPVGIIAFGIVLWVFYRYGTTRRSSPYTRLARLAGDDDGEGPSDDDGTDRVIASTRSAFKADDFDDDELLGSKSDIGSTTAANA